VGLRFLVVPFTLLLTIDESCGWRRCRSSAKDRIRRGRGQLDYGEDGVRAVEVVREFEAVCAMADTSFDDKGVSATLTV
jgi:hypothetical protein